MEGLSKAHFLDYGKLYALTDLATEEFVQWARELGASVADVEVWAQGLRRLTQAAELRAKAAQRGFAKRSREELTYCLSERREDSHATGWSSGGTRSDGPPPPLGGRHWPGGRGKKKATRGTAAGRADSDKRERGRAVAKPVVLLDFLDLPLAARARQCHDKTVHLRRGARGLRVSTLRMCVRAWTKLQTWLEATLGRSCPRSVNDVLGYLECPASGGKSAGVLLQVLQAVRFIDAAGEVRGGLALATPQFWTTSCASTRFR